VTQLMYLMDHSGFEGADTHIINEEARAVIDSVDKLGE